MTINRAEILGKYPDAGAHAKDHAIQAADLALNISHLPEYEHLLDPRDRELIEASALVHDLGYLDRQPYWSTTQWEYPYRSLDQIDSIFPQFSEVEREIIKLVVLNHDSENWIYLAQHLEIPKIRVLMID